MSVGKDIIKLCKKSDKTAQEIVFREYAPIILSLCLRYINDRAKAEDVMQDSFITVFTKIKQYNGIGSFEGWIKRIALNTALMQLRRDKKEIVSGNFEFYEYPHEIDENQSNMSLKDSLRDSKSLIQNAKFSQDDIFETIRELPTGFRTVFNLYVIEGYKHKEIAKKLNITTGTSKSQLLRARKKIEELLYKKAIDKLKKASI